MSLLAEGKEHDPGGKVRRALDPGVIGDAYFIRDKMYRPLLSRELKKGGEGAIMFIGMNPSTAGANWNDPTVDIEQRMAFKLGYAMYLKTNVMDICVTDSTKLIEMQKEGVLLCSKENFDLIKVSAKYCKAIVLTYGKLHSSYQHYADAIVEELRKSHTLMCLGKNKDGSPKHPLYLPKNTPLIPF